MNTQSEVNAVEQSHSQQLLAASVHCGDCRDGHKPEQCLTHEQEHLVCHKLNNFSRVFRSIPIVSQAIAHQVAHDNVP